MYFYHIIVYNHNYLFIKIILIFTSNVYDIDLIYPILVILKYLPIFGSFPIVTNSFRSVDVLELLDLGIDKIIVMSTKIFKNELKIQMISWMRLIIFFNDLMKIINVTMTILVRTERYY